MIFRDANIGGTDYTEKELLGILGELDYDTVANNEEYRMFYDFWLCVAVCHDVIKEESKEESNDITATKAAAASAGENYSESATVQFQGSSPDEICLVEAAYKLNFRFFKRTSN